MFEKILVPYDGSKPADSAVRYAAGLANLAKNNCQITLVSIVPRIPAAPLILERPMRVKGGGVISLSEYVEQLYEQMQQHAEGMLERKRKEIEAQAGSSAAVVTAVMVSDRVSDQILELAENSDLIVVGNVGLSGLSKLKTLGSVSRSIVERAPCPVMIVR